jgi:hypothetical protein
MTEPSIRRHAKRTDEEARVAFEVYALAVGKVVHAWNYLHEALGQLLYYVTDPDDGRAALSKWYSIKDDRRQRAMLRAVVLRAPEDRWPPQALAATEDVIWLLDRADQLADERNDAIHAPVSMVTDCTGMVVHASIAAYVNGHPRARKLWGKRLVVEFERCEKVAGVLSSFAGEAVMALVNERHPWPARPSLPLRVLEQEPLSIDGH